MITLTNAVVLPAPVDRVWAWFTNLDENYPSWHPEHLRWRTLIGEPLTDGSVVFIDEWIGPLRLSGRSFIHSVRPKRGFSFRLGLPGSLVRAGGGFAFEPTEAGGCRMRQEVRLGYAPPAGRAMDPLLRAALPLHALRRHMREEGANLAALLDRPGAAR